MTEGRTDFVKGTYGYDVAFLEKNKISTIELKDRESKVRVLLVPAWQGRVMTSSAIGKEGKSFGWINHDLIDSGKINNRFNPFGGEERFWFGPEGGPYSLFFKEGEEQIYSNWNVPPVLDTETYEIKKLDAANVTFGKTTVLKNASGSEFNMGIERRVSLLSRDNICSLFGIELPYSILDIVAYRSENVITNTGGNVWTKDKGLISVWMLGMFAPSPSTAVFIPYKTNGTGAAVNDDYFCRLSSDRLVVENGMVFFRIDGKLRSKIGILPGRAKDLCGSYDSASKTLTVVWYSQPPEQSCYLNSKWGAQEDPFAGDVINAYNDGPLEDGSIMGPFYEIETSSPGAELNANESLTHTQIVMHIQGDEAGLSAITEKLFNITLCDIAMKFTV